MDRRRFMKVASAGVAGVAAARPADAAHWRWPAEDIRVGVIGVGSRGQSVMRTFLRFHADHVAAALDNGQHVFGEKLMAYDLDGCRRIVEARQRTGRIYQVGHQYRYAAWTREAIRRVKAGEIGDVTHIFAYWHRNNNWRRPLPQQPVPGFTATELER